MNCHWWKLRSEIQGLKPPSMRNNTQFDAGAKYHVAGDVGYVRYFTAFIYEFQFYRELCLASGENGRKGFITFLKIVSIKEKRRGVKLKSFLKCILLQCQNDSVLSL